LNVDIRKNNKRTDVDIRKTRYLILIYVKKKKKLRWSQLKRKILFIFN